MRVPGIREPGAQGYWESLDKVRTETLAQTLGKCPSHIYDFTALAIIILGIFSPLA